MTATRSDCSTNRPGLYLAFELGWTEWKLAFATAQARSPGCGRSGPATWPSLHEEIAKAKKRFGLPDDAPVCSCYEAGRDGFWLHRYLTTQGVRQHASSIRPASRSIGGKRRAKSDRLDAAKLVTMLLRYHGGEKKVWSVVRVPSVADEDAPPVAPRTGRTQGRADRAQSIASRACWPARVWRCRRWTRSFRHWLGSCAFVGRLSRCRPDCSSGCCASTSAGSWSSRQIKDLEKRAAAADPLRTRRRTWTRCAAAGAVGRRVNGAWLLVLRAVRLAAVSATASRWASWRA